MKFKTKQYQTDVVACEYDTDVSDSGIKFRLKWG